MRLAMKRCRDERGFALIMVMAMMLVVAFMATSMSRSARLKAVGLRNNADILVASSLAEAALDLAKLDLSRRAAARLYRRDGTVYTVGLDGGDASFAIQDEAGKMSLRVQAGQEHADLIARVAQRLGIEVAPVSLAAAIRAVDPRSIGDLALVPGMPPALHAALVPHVTVYSEGPRIRLAHASADVIASIPGVTPALAADIARSKRAGARLPPLGEAAAFAASGEGPVYTVVATGRAASGIEARLTEVVHADGRTAGGQRNGIRVIERR